MILAERAILLLLDAAPGNCATASDLLLVSNLLSKRYAWDLETNPGRLGRILAALVGLYLLHGPQGFRLDEGGRAELESMRRRKGAFCTKFSSVASEITTNCIGKRNRYANLRLQMPGSGLCASV